MTEPESVNKICVYIATKNREYKLRACIRAISKGCVLPNKIIVINQGLLFHQVESFRKLINIEIINSKTVGKSRALNLEISKMKEGIVAFTDDDCLADKFWLQNILLTFNKNKDVVGVFGKILPFQPKKHLNRICPSTFENNQIHRISSPGMHWKTIGFGSNMAFRKETFEKIGLFKEWLGPGSIGKGAEDAEFALRSLVRGYILIYNPNIIIYHNKWLTRAEMKTQSLIYTCGEMACYGYYSLLGYRFAQRVVFNNFTQSVFDIKKIAGDILKRRIIKPNSWIYPYSVLCMRMRGFVIGLWYYVTETLFK